MKKFRFRPPYSDDKNIIAGITAFRPSLKRSGVYLIKENNEIVYVGFSGTDLYTTMYRHFQTWNDKKGPRVTYFSKLKKKYYTVRVVYCTPLQAAKLEKSLIAKYQPRDNVQYIDHELLKSDLNVLSLYNDTPVERISPF
jgi:hypothetical protein